ncbi:MAG: MFS transporter [Bacteroidales bacterium]|nr:MFS transporter [Bacteroidales bacterium]
MAQKRTSFSKVFWVANSIEVLERFAYYGIYMGFSIYFATLGFKTEQLGVIQAFFLLISYTIPVFSGTFADRFGFKKILIISYLAYLPSIILLIVTKTFSGIALTMLSIGLAAGIFKPLISGTIRVVTDSTNRTLGFGIFYAMVNIGASFGPLILGRLRAISWEYAYIAAAIAIALMLGITIFFYREPKRDIQGETLGKKFRDMGIALADLKFTSFLIILGIFFWTPFWAFFNLCPKYVELSLDGAKLYEDIRGVLGTWVANFLSQDVDGRREVLGETISHTGWVIMIFQILISFIFERFKTIPSFIFGLVVAASGFVMIWVAGLTNPAWVFLGIFLFAIGEMITSPRIQEYITWLAPKEKAGLYMGTNFLAVGIGGFLSGVVYTSGFYSFFERINHTEYIWLIMAGHVILGVVVILLFTYFAGHFREQES